MMPFHEPYRLIWVHIPKYLQNAVVGHISLRFFLYGHYKMVVALPDDLFRACTGSYPEFYEHGADTIFETAPV